MNIDNLYFFKLLFQQSNALLISGWNYWSIQKKEKVLLLNLIVYRLISFICTDFNTYGQSIRNFVDWGDFLVFLAWHWADWRRRDPQIISSKCSAFAGSALTARAWICSSVSLISPLSKDKTHFSAKRFSKMDSANSTDLFQNDEYVYRCYIPESQTVDEKSGF